MASVARAQNITEDRASGATVINNSLTFNRSTNGFLKWTPKGSGDRQTWTWSAWVKRNGHYGDRQVLFCGRPESSNYCQIEFDGDDNLKVFGDMGGLSSGGLFTLKSLNRTYRDQGWYHIVWHMNVRDGTAANRCRFYVNGVDQNPYVTGTYPPSVKDAWYVNGYREHSIGGLGGSLVTHMSDVQMAEVHFIDGQALDASYFGYTDPLTNTWRPKKFSGQYRIESTGTNPNNGTTWSGLWSPASGTFDQAVSNAFTGYLKETNRARTSGNAVLCTMNLSSNNITLDGGTDGLIVIAEPGYESTVTATISGTTHTSSSGSVHVFTQSGTLTQLTVVNNSGTGRTYLEGVVVNGFILTDGQTGGGLWSGLNSFYLPFSGDFPIQEDKSDNLSPLYNGTLAKDWTPVNIGGLVALDKATGALPILNTKGGGFAGGVGVRTDPYHANLVLALPLAGWEGDVSNLINSGSTQKTVTPGGDPSSSVWGGNYYGRSWSFDGSGDYLAVTHSTDFEMGSGAFTVEAWVYVDSHGADKTIVGSYKSSPDWQLTLAGGASNNIFMFSIWNGSATVSAESDVLDSAWIDQWVHVCGQRTGNTLQIIVNGRLSGTASFSGSAPNVNTTLDIGGRGDSYGFMTGQIQDVRVYKGIAKYTVSSIGDIGFIPGSSTPTVVQQTPSGVSYGSHLTVPVNGAVAFGDWVSETGPIITGSSAELNITSDTQTFTIEAWIYPYKIQPQSPAHEYRYTGIVSQGQVYVNFGYEDTGILRWYTYDGTAHYIDSAEKTVQTGCWQHVAVVSNAGAIKLYHNGIQVASGTLQDPSGGQSDAIHIGNADLTFQSDAMLGMMSNLRITTTAVYTAAFTPPTAPLTSITGTKLLCCQDPNSPTTAATATSSLSKAGAVSSCLTNLFDNNINMVKGVPNQYATIDPLSSVMGSSSSFTLSQGNLHFLGTGNNDDCACTLATPDHSGKWYYELRILANPTTTVAGWSTREVIQTEAVGTSAFTYYKSICTRGNGEVEVWDTNVTDIGSWSIGDVIGYALDLDNNQCHISKNGVRVASATVPTDKGVEWCPVIGDSSSGDSETLSNFGQQPFSYPPPDDYQCLCVANFPRPGLAVPSEYIKPVLYTGNGGTNPIDVSWKPDLTIIKVRSETGAWRWNNSVMGAGQMLDSTGDAAVYDDGPSGDDMFPSFNPNGFTAKGTGASYNKSSATYVSYNWKAGGSDGTFNVDGRSYSTAAAAGLDAGNINPSGASINTQTGFSIIKYTGSGVSGNTVAHGLTKEPAFVIVKKYEEAGNWGVYHQGLTDNTKVLTLNTDNAEVTPTDAFFTWNNTTTNLLGLGDNTITNDNTEGTIAFLWADVPGLQKFGKYKGSGDNNGTVVYLGFRPAVVWVKCTSDAGQEWVVWDDVRDVYNKMTTSVYIQSNASEASVGTTRQVDFLSNGFKLRNGSSGATDYGSRTYIYCAWAHQPLHNLYGASSNGR